MTSSRTTDAATIRLARETDPPLTSRVLAAALNELYRRRSVPLVVGDDSRRGLHEHLLRHDPQRFWIAERNGHVVGFSVGIDRGAWWFLSALFVHPEAQGAGVGRQLLARAMAGRPVSDGVAAAISSARAARVEHALRPSRPTPVAATGDVRRHAPAPVSAGTRLSGGDKAQCGRPGSGHADRPGRHRGRPQHRPPLVSGAGRPAWLAVPARRPARRLCVRLFRRCHRSGRRRAGDRHGAALYVGAG